MSRVSGTSSSQPTPPFGNTSPNVPQIAKQMQTQTTALAEHLQEVLGNPYTSTTDSSFLQQFAENSHNLNGTVKQAMEI
jgi:hypothetical protein